MTEMRALPLHWKIFLATLVGFFAFWTYGSAHFARDPGSLLFFDPKRAYERKYSVVREEEVLKFRRQRLDAVDGGRGVERRGYGKGDAETCAVIVSVDRRLGEGDVHPLETTIFSALAGLTPAERRSLHLHVYLAHTDPTSHSLWGSPLLDASNNIIDGLSTPFSVQAPREDIARLQFYENQRRLNPKTALDISFALQSCLETVPNAKFIALIEDDILFAEGWYAQALAGLAQIETTENGRHQRWMDLRLFRPESNTGWSDRTWLGNHVPLVILLLDSLLLSLVHGLRTYKRRFGRSALPHHTKLTRLSRLPTESLIVLCLFTIPLLVITFFATGKASLTLPRRSGAHLQDWGCCTQTVFFPSRNVPHLIHSLRTHTTETTPDEIVGQHAKMVGLHRYVLDPVLVQHRGARASVITPGRNGQVGKGLLWSAAFEDLDGEVLRREHLRIAGKMFPGE